MIQLLLLKLSRQPDCSRKFKYMPLSLLLSGSPQFLELTLRVGLSADREASRLANDRSQSAWSGLLVNRGYEHVESSNIMLYY